MLCVWDQEGVIFYELLKPGEIINAHRYYQQLIKLHRALREKRPHYRKRHNKLIFLYDNAPSHTSTIVQNFLETLNSALGSVGTPSRLLQTWHLLTITCFRRGPRAHWAAFRFLRRSENGLMSGASKDEKFFWCGIHKLPERWEKCIVSEGKYFE